MERKRRWQRWRWRQLHNKVDRWVVLNHLSFFNDEIRQPPIYVPHLSVFNYRIWPSRMQKHSAEAEAAAAAAAHTAIAFHMIIMTIAMRLLCSCTHRAYPSHACAACFISFNLRSCITHSMNVLFVGLTSWACRPFNSDTFHLLILMDVLAIDNVPYNRNLLFHFIFFLYFVFSYRDRS